MFEMFVRFGPNNQATLLSFCVSLLQAHASDVRSTAVVLMIEKNGRETGHGTAWHAQAFLLYHGGIVGPRSSRYVHRPSELHQHVHRLVKLMLPKHAVKLALAQLSLE